MIIPAGGAVYLKPIGTERRRSPKSAFVGFIHLRRAAGTDYQFMESQILVVIQTKVTKTVRTAKHSVTVALLS